MWLKPCFTIAFNRWLKPTEIIAVCIVCWFAVAEILLPSALANSLQLLKYYCRLL